MLYRVRLLALLSLPFLISCARFRTSTLKPEKIFAATIGSEKIVYPKQSGIYHEIPSRVGVHKEWIALSEPSEKTIKLFRSGKLEAVIRAQDSGKTKNDAKGLEALRIPGRIMMGVNDDFFVENYIPPEGENKEASSRGGYKILQFDFKGKLLRSIGRKGLPELVFENLLWFDADSKGYLWVLYRYLDELHLDRYEGSRLAYEYRQTDCENATVDKKQIEQLKSRNSIVHCEYIYPFYSGERIMFASRIDRIDTESDKKQMALAYRVVKVKNLGEAENKTVFDRLANAEDHPYLPQGGNYVGIWQNLENGRVRVQRYSLDGDLTNSIVLDMTGRVSQWRQVWSTLSGNFYGIRIFSDQFEIYKFQ
ncbi:MAG TPA: hypothetical protein PLY93_01025 [Turneriella sp.]|nr:hypothetical protein [Turneriella sp.]